MSDPKLAHGAQEICRFLRGEGQVITCDLNAANTAIGWLRRAGESIQVTYDASQRPVVTTIRLLEELVMSNPNPEAESE